MLVSFTDSRALRLLLQTNPKQERKLVQTPHFLDLAAFCAHVLRSCETPIRGQQTWAPARLLAGDEGLVRGDLPAAARVRLFLKQVGSGRRLEVEARRSEVCVISGCSRGF